MAVEGSRVLVLTLPIELVGGVQSKAKFLAAHLNSHGHDVTIASYVTRSSPREVNASWLSSLFGEEGRVESSQSENGYKNIYIGCRFPGAEFTYTESSSAWRRVLDSHNRIIAVGGTPLIAYPAASIGKKFILWCADDLDGDREARISAMSKTRRFIDKAWIMPKLVQQQSVVLNAGMPLRGVSRYTVNRLNLHFDGRDADVGQMPIPIEDNFFQPLAELKRRGVMGFAGRISDHRKNARLLFETFQELRYRGIIHELHIAGPADKIAIDLVKSLGISDSVKFHGYLSRDQLRLMYQSLEVFAITSDREGLGISGLEAMACGVPVVSTRCGGPEDFVKDGITGYISPASPVRFADYVCRLLADKENYKQISNECRQLVRKNFSVAVFSEALEKAWLSAWKESYIN